MVTLVPMTSHLLRVVSYISTVESVSAEKTVWTSQFFKPVAVVLLYNVCDLCGRTLATIFQWPGIYHQCIKT